MSNPLPNEQEIYEKIKKEKLAIHPVIWELINHHVYNDVHMINFILGATVLDGEPLSEENAKKVIQHAKEIKEFLETLERATKPKQEDV